VCVCVYVYIYISVSYERYLAHKKNCPPRTLQWDYTWGPMVVLGAGAVSYERGTSVCTHAEPGSEQILKNGHVHSESGPRSRLPRPSVQTGGPDVIRKKAWPFYRTTSGVRLCWELAGPEGPKVRTTYANRQRGSSSHDRVQGDRNRESQAAACVREVPP
jgi:hypothetical protein